MADRAEKNSPTLCRFQKKWCIFAMKTILNE